MNAIAVPASKAERSSAEQRELPSRARVVVVGAGVIGSSVAYYLSRLGCRDVLLVERKSIGCGTTWHSHGVVGLVRASQTLLRMAMETVRMIADLERDTGKSTGYSARGSINVTADPSRLIQFRRFADIARTEGLPVEIVDAAEARRIWPHLNTDGLIGAMHLPTEGQCNPLDLTQALVAGARLGGVQIVEGVAVTGAEIDGGRIVAIDTEAGRVECETLVNCTGLWGRDFLRAETGGLPLQGVEHNYLVAEFSEEVTEGLPVLRDPDAVMTVREDARQLSFGFNERVARLFAENGVPETFEFDQLQPDWDAAAPYLAGVMARVPLLNDLGIRHFVCGPEAATPDTRYLLGPMANFPNYFVAAGFTGIGIGAAGGVGLAIAQWILERAPTDSLWEVDVQRMMPYQSNRTYLMRRTVESNGKLFPINWPHRQNLTARNARRSPLHHALQQARACFSEVGGWEVPEWFAPEGMEPAPLYSFEKPGWFPHARMEAQAALKAVVLADRSMMGKFLVAGRHAEIALEGLCAYGPGHAVDRPIQTPILNERGGIEALFTLIRHDEDAFLLFGEAAAQTRNLALLRQRLNGKGDVSVVDMTSAFAAMDVIGPRSADLLQATGWRGRDEDRSRGFDDRAEIGLANAILWREERLPVSAWTMVIPTEFAAGTFEALTEAGEACGLGLIGSHAYQSLRTAAGSPIWPQGIGPRHSPIEAGMSALVDLSDGREFPGRTICAQQRAEGVKRRLVRLRLDEEEAVLLGHEPIAINGHPAGALNQAAYALATDRAVGLAYLSTGEVIPPGKPFCGQCEVVVDGRTRTARYDSPGAGEFGTRPSSEAI